ncbi:MAG TPA: STAS domain-containing protein [Solirubrobacteraceae bacterium]|nr:STAS domain-containing protein [Solirubrobacteraceae bacterium]
MLRNAPEAGNNRHVEGVFEIDFDGPSRHRRLHVRGELDLASSQDLIRALRRACDEGARSVMLDLHELGHMDSAGIYALLSGRKICEECGCGYVIERGMSGPAEKTLEVTGLLDQLPFC